jgi:DNA-binding NarL/FixJ family response regulator
LFSKIQTPYPEFAYALFFMRILLVDDHILFAKGLIYLLNDVMPNLNCTSVHSLHQALAVSGPFDLILLDYNLPNTQGHEGLKKIRQVHGPTTSVVILSGMDATPAIIHELVDDGACGFIPKSSDIDTLLSALRIVLNRGVYLPPNAYQVVNPPTQASKRIAKQLTCRHWEILTLLHQGNSNRQIATILQLTENTVKTHLKTVFRLLEVNNRTQAVLKISALGLSPKR